MMPNYANETKVLARFKNITVFLEAWYSVEIIATTDDLTAYDLVIDPMHFMMSARLQ